MPAIVIGCCTASRIFCADVRRVLGMPQLGEDDRELVAADAGHRVVLADAVAEALRHLQQQLVAGRVAEGVVDGLEVIEVDEHHRQRLPAAARAIDAEREAVGEELPVGRCVRTS